MIIKKLIVPMLLGLSVLVNILFVLTFALAAQSKNSSLLFAVPEGQIAVATVACFPKTAPFVFSPVEITLRPRESITLQYSVFASRRQSNLLIAPLYDPDIVSVQTDGGVMRITAVAEGETVIQTLTNDGITDMVFVTVSE